MYSGYSKRSIKTIFIWCLLSLYCKRR